MPASTALKATKCACVVSAMRRASVVLPVPGGPQRMIDCSRSRSIASRSGLPGREQVLLADELVERARPHPLGERRAAARPRRAWARRRRRGSWSFMRASASPPLPARFVEDAAPAATAALSDSTGARIGIVTRTSAAATMPSGRPGAFAADEQRSGPREVGVVQRRAAARRRRDDRARRAAGRRATRRADVVRAAIGSRSALPIEPRSAFQPNGSRRARRSTTTPVAPAASAARTIAPTLPGILHVGQRTTTSARRAAPRRALEPAGATRAMATTPDGRPRRGWRRP